MNKLLTALFALAVASVTGLAHAQTPAAPKAKASTAAAAPAAQKTAAAAPAAAGAKSIEAKVAMCVGCHGIRGYQASFPEVYKVPMIAGQSAKYIVAALTAYKQGERKHPTMRGIADSLSDQDMADIAGYYENLGKDPAHTLPAAADKTPNAQVAALLQKAACVSCHGANFAKPIDPSYPENNAQMGRSNGVMAAIAKQFSNAELKALSGYVSSLEGDLKTVPDPRFR